MGIKQPDQLCQISLIESIRRLHLDPWLGAACHGHAAGVADDLEHGKIVGSVTHAEDLGQRHRVLFGEGKQAGALLGRVDDGVDGGELAGEVARGASLGLGGEKLRSEAGQ